MHKGTVKWFNPTKGYGFIKPMVGDKDVFVHISAVERAGLTTLNENQVIEYDLVENRGKTSAENLKVSQSSSRSAQAILMHPRPLPGDFAVWLTYDSSLRAISSSRANRPRLPGGRSHRRGEAFRSPNGAKPPDRCDVRSPGCAPTAFPAYRHREPQPRPASRSGRHRFPP